MKKENKRNLYVSLCMLAFFVLWTWLISFVDVKALGPDGSRVGFATLNGFVHRLTGVHMTLYNITDWAGLVPVAVGLGFAVLGLVQWIRRKNILKVDFDVLVLGGFYILVLGVYLLFEEVVINYRPILINDFLEASYPSSTTLLVMTVMPTALVQCRQRIKHSEFRIFVSAVLAGFILLVVAGRLLSGVHWFTDIIGASMLSAGLVKLYVYVVNLKCK